MDFITNDDPSIEHIPFETRSFWRRSDFFSEDASMSYLNRADSILQDECHLHNTSRVAEECLRSSIRITPNVSEFFRFTSTKRAELVSEGPRHGGQIIAALQNPQKKEILPFSRSFTIRNSEGRALLGSSMVC
ncbi:hypothetical protein TNCV_2609171 [Trichonephila clavipes]|nr:hypothetical protein TNCV_2609171 [Trichonephila clavipes]